MKKLLPLLLIAYPISFLHAQEAATKAASDSNAVFTIVQQQPRFKGDLYKYLADNIVYPKDALNNNITGKVYITFVVEKDGSISGVKVIRGVYASLDAEAVRVISGMPKWTPGTQNGNLVRVQYNIPINFEIRDTKKSDQDTKKGDRSSGRFN